MRMPYTALLVVLLGSLRNIDISAVSQEILRVRRYKTMYSCIMVKICLSGNIKRKTNLHHAKGYCNRHMRK